MAVLVAACLALLAWGVARSETPDAMAPVPGDPTAVPSSPDGSTDDVTAVPPVQAVELTPSEDAADGLSDGETPLDAVTSVPRDDDEGTDLAGRDDATAPTVDSAAESVTGLPSAGLEPAATADEDELAAEIAQLEAEAAERDAADEQVLADLHADAAELAAASEELAPGED